MECLIMRSPFTQLSSFAIFLSVANLAAISLVFPGFDAKAQITPDQTLGSERSTIVPNQTIRGINSDRIEGGAIRGANLFHSFQEFNIDSGRGAYFSNPEGITNILSRVTGRNLSRIFGTLGVLGNANLFLINPNGIIFGPNAQLDITGSFLATTADSLNLGDEWSFSAVNPAAPPLLSINITPGLQLGIQQSQGVIESRGNLSVGQDLTLAAHNLHLQGQLHAEQNLTLQARETIQAEDQSNRPFITQAGNQLTLQGNQGISLSPLSNPNSQLVSGGNMVLRSDGQIEGEIQQYWSGGNFQIEQLNGGLGDFFSPNGTQIQARENVRFRNYEGGSLQVRAGGEINLGKIEITGVSTSNSEQEFTSEQIPLSNGTVIQIDSQTQPTLDLRSGTTITAHTLLSSSAPLTNSQTARIAIDDVTISEPNGLVFLTNQYQPRLLTNRSGSEIRLNSITAPSGQMVTDSRSNIILNGQVDVSAPFTFDLSVFTPSELEALLEVVEIDSNLNIDFSNLNLEELIEVFVSDAPSESNNFDVISTAILKLVSAFNFEDNGGDITLLADNNIIFNPGSTIESAGIQGGRIQIRSGNFLALDDTFVASITGDNQPGNTVALSAQSVFLSNFSGVFNFKRGSEEGGNINVKATDTVSLLEQGGSSILHPNNPIISVIVQLLSQSTGIATGAVESGKSGDISITANQFRIRSESIENSPEASDGIGVFSQQLIGIDTGVLPGNADAGDLRVDASERVEIIGNEPQAEIFQFSQESVQAIIDIDTGLLTSTIGSGNSGNLELNTGRLIIQDGAVISTSSGRAGSGAGGRLTINATESINFRGRAGLVNGTVLSSNAGELIVNVPTGQIVLKDGAGILGDTRGAGNSGQLILNAGELQILSGSRVGSGTVGQGSGDKITINATTIEVSGTSVDGTVPSGIFTTAVSSSTGVAGDLDIRTGELIVTDGGTIAASNQGIQAGGTIQIQADTLTLDRGTITAETAQNLGGSVTLRIDDRVLLSNDSQITATAGLETGEGDGGNVTINAPFMINFPGSENQITANAFQGRGGNIEITTDFIFGLQSLTIDASSQLGGLDGTVSIRSPEVDLVQETTNLPDELEPPQLLQGCEPGSSLSKSRFINAGRGGLSPSPTEPLSSIEVWRDIQLPDHFSRGNDTVTETDPQTEVKPIVEATGLVVDEKGNLILVAEKPCYDQEKAGYKPRTLGRLTEINVHKPL
ncbi:MAG: filamentous hemagglutinin N-terminal domain-containing protein [Cyanobacteria bacterium J06592_8]